MKPSIFILLATIICNFVSIQEGSGQEKAPVRIYLEHTRQTDRIQLDVRVIAKVDKRYRPMAGLVVELYNSEVSDNNLIGRVLTGADGTNTYQLSREQFDLAKTKKIANYYALLLENDTLQGKEKKISIQAVEMEMEFAEVDSIKQIVVHVYEEDSVGARLLMDDVDVEFFVDRPLSPLPIGEGKESTDANGRVTTDFPDDLPGDTDGHLLVIARIVEHDDYGTVEISQIKQWGIPTIIDDDTLKRSLWGSSANTPISLLVFINALIVGVWGMIYYMIYKIFVIRKLGLKKEHTN